MARRSFTVYSQDSGKWREYAACRGQSHEGLQDIWYPIPANEISAEAKAICASCIVQEECLSFAIRDEGAKNAADRVGIYAGTTPSDRARMWRTRKKARAIPKFHQPEYRSCSCGCGGKFDAWLTIEGRPRKIPRIYATRDCQRAVMRQDNTKRPRWVVCKLEGCHTMFNPFVSFKGVPGNTPRVYCGAEHQRLGVRITRMARRSSNV